MWQTQTAPSEAPLNRARPAAEALYFDSGNRTLFGWLHWPGDGRYSDVGVVECKPFGYEAICAHRSVRAFAEACAALGAPTLRFDYSGTADSSDIDPAADQIELWTSDIVAAVNALQQRTGVSRICLLGVRLGSLLAGLASRRCPQVNALILIAPIVSGRRYLKDLHVMRLAAALLPDGANTVPASPGSIEIGGFHLSQASISSLREADLETTSAPAVDEMLIIDGASLPVSRTWSGQLAAAGRRVAYHALPGMLEMAFTAPQFAAVPQQMIVTVQDWLTRTAFMAEFEVRTLVRPPPSASPVLRVLDEPGLNVSITERPVSLGKDNRIFGIITEPRAGERRRRAVLLLNAGADVHTGPSGISVALARNWARHGYAVLRMDFAGIGDSATPTGHVDNEVFPQTAVDDMRAAVEFMRSRYQVCDLTVAGMCSGAYHTLQSAIGALPVNRLLMVNPQNFFWNTRMSVHGMQVAELVSRPVGKRTLDKLISIAFWRRLVTGRIDVGYIAKLHARRIEFLVTSTLRDAARSLRIRLPNDLGGQLEEIARRGVRIVLVFARGEPGIDLLKRQAGTSLERIGERLRMHIIDGADHVFSKLGPRRQLEEILSEELYRLADSTEPKSHR